MSASESEEENPIGKLILEKAARKRKAFGRSGCPDDALGVMASDPDIIEIIESDGRDVGNAAKDKKKKRRQDRKKRKKQQLDEQANMKRPATVELLEPEFSDKTSVVLPVGVQLVDESIIAQEAEMSKLLKLPRYFDDTSGQGADHSRRCFNCGLLGHAARECTNATRERPCYLCARPGHEGRDCPNRICFRCGQSGHKVRDCTFARGGSDLPDSCLRCGLPRCSASGKGDYARYEGACTSKYSERDLRSCKCYVCGQYGHLCCIPAPQDAVTQSCYVCASYKHTGENCPSEDRPHVAAERSGDLRRTLMETEAEFERMRDWEATHSGRDSGGSRGGTYRPSYSQDGRSDAGKYHGRNFSQGDRHERLHGTKHDMHEDSQGVMYHPRGSKHQTSFSRNHRDWETGLHRNSKHSHHKSKHESHGCRSHHSKDSSHVHKSDSKGHHGRHQSKHHHKVAVKEKPMKHFGHRRFK